MQIVTKNSAQGSKFCSLFIAGIIIFVFGCVPERENPGIEKLSIMLEDSRDISIFDICSEIELIPLETSDSALLSIIYVKPCQSAYYVKQNNPQQVFCFDSTGRLRFKIGACGRGDKEYASLADIAVNSYSHSLYLLETLDKLNLYDLDGRFENKIFLDSIKENLNTVIPLNQDTLLLVSGRNSNIYSFFSLKHGKMIDRKLAPMPMVSVSPFFCEGGKVFHYTWYGNIVYLVEGTSFVPSFYLNFGKYNNDGKCDTISEDMFSNEAEIGNYLKKFKVIIFNMQSNKDYLYLVLADNTKNEPVFKRVLYHKKTKQSIVFENFKERVNWNIFDNLTDGYFISTINAANKEEVLDVNLLDDVNRQRYEKIDLNDNPVIVRFKLK